MRRSRNKTQAFLPEHPLLAFKISTHFYVLCVLFIQWASLFILETLIMKKLMYIGLSVIACSAIANISMANELEEVIVTSSLIDASANEISNPLHIVNGESISRDAAQSIGSLIDGLAGVSSSDFGAAVGQPVIRGLSGSRVKVLNNGKVVRDISSLGPDHSNEIDLGHLEQIEIVRGPSSLLYANGAIGGIVNIVDNTIAKQDIESFKFNVGAGYEDGNSGKTGNASFAENIGGINVSSSVQYSNLGNYAIPEGAVTEEHEGEEHEGEEHDHDANTLENSDFAKTGFKLGLSKVEDWGYVGLSYADSSSTYGIPFHGEHHDHCEEHPDDCEVPVGGGDPVLKEGIEEEEEEEEERIFSTTDSKTVNFEGSYNFNSSFVNSAEYYIRDTEYVLAEQHAEEEHPEEEEEHDEGTVFRNDSLELGLNLDIGNDQKIAFNVSEEEFSIDGKEKFLELTVSDELMLGYFLSHDLSFAHFDFGIRHDQIERKSVAGNYDDNLTSFSTALSRELSDNLNVNFGVSSVQKAPSAMELFVNGPHLATQRFEKGNATLSPEKANNIDLSFNTAIAGFDANLSLYKNSISNYIYQYDTEDKDEETGLVISEYRQQDAIFKGYELEISRSIALKNGNLAVSLARDYVDAQFKQGGYIPRSVPARNILNLNYKANNGLDLLVSIKDVQKQSKVAADEDDHEDDTGTENDDPHDHGETPTDGFQWVNLSLSKEIKTSDTEVLKVSFFAKNLLNKVARNHSSFVKEEVPLPGRNIGIKANYSF